MKSRMSVSHLCLIRPTGKKMPVSSSFQSCSASIFFFFSASLSSLYPGGSRHASHRPIVAAYSCCSGPSLAVGSAFIWTSVSFRRSDDRCAASLAAISASVPPAPGAICALLTPSARAAPPSSASARGLRLRTPVSATAGGAPATTSLVSPPTTVAPPARTPSTIVAGGAAPPGGGPRVDACVSSERAGVWGAGLSHHPEVGGVVRERSSAEGVGSTATKRRGAGA
eukprot:1460312-Prymnesium_polylepis.1